MKREGLPVRTSDSVVRVYEQMASSYDGWMRPFDRLLVGNGRRRIVARAAGRTLELAIGTGLNLPFYPQGLQLTGIDVTPAMLAIAARRAQALGLQVELRQGDAQALDFPDEHFDTVVCTLALCTIPDERRALAEAGRVLRPGGQLLLLEHVRSPIGPVRWAERLLDPLLVRLAGDHLLRDPLDHLEPAGFQIERCNRSRWGLMEEVVARKSKAGTQPGAAAASEAGFATSA
jgi:ubiquinone/menaquinone biosynthesis C-methylase UbiE